MRNDLPPVHVMQLLLETPDVDQFLGRLAVLAAEAVGTPASCGITMRLDAESRTVAWSDVDAAMYDEIQYGRGQGPCIQVLRSATVVDVPGLAAEDRWEAYRIRALAQGQRSSFSVPLVHEQAAVGALNLYSRQAHAFDGVRQLLLSFAGQASLALSVLLRQGEKDRVTDQLREALSSRTVIDQAVGIVMSQQSCTAEEAFGVLRTASQHGNRKLRDVAARLVRAVSGHDPRPGRSFMDL